MTEQEKREKAIEVKDLAQLMRTYCHDKIPDCNSNKDCDECMAKLLVDKGYRKEEEVQKETALKILNRLVDVAEKHISDDYKGIFAAKVAIEMEEVIKKEFGVEIEDDESRN